MKGVIYLAWKYLSYHRWKTITLAATITLMLFIPAAMQILIEQTSQQLKARAVNTPLLIGARGSPLELVLNSLYLEAKSPTPLTYEEVIRLRKKDSTQAIPLHVRFRAQGAPIVGTELAYFDYRKLTIIQGRQLAQLGDAIVGANVASRLDLQVGDTVISSPESAFDLSGVYPLKMPVVGILTANNSPDDNAIFVDVKTTWVIAGIGHGHQDLTRPEAVAKVLTQSATNNGTNVVANASLIEFNEITDSNRNSFHFHGNATSHPLTAIIPVPNSQKDTVILQGRYQSRSDNVQIVRPQQVMNELIKTIFTVKQYVLAAMLILGISTMLVVVFVFLLSLRLRKREMETLMRIGGGKNVIAAMVIAEVLVVITISLLLAFLLTWGTQHWGSNLVQTLLVT